jgi:hypothetical protein
LRQRGVERGGVLAVDEEREASNDKAARSGCSSCAWKASAMALRRRACSFSMVC